MPRLSSVLDPPARMPTEAAPAPRASLVGGVGFLSGESKALSSQGEKGEGWIMMNGQRQARGRRAWL